MARIVPARRCPSQRNELDQEAQEICAKRDRRAAHGRPRQCRAERQLGVATSGSDDEAFGRVVSNEIDRCNSGRDCEDGHGHDQSLLRHPTMPDAFGSQ
jgi:hypothetical protein